MVTGSGFDLSEAQNYWRYAPTASDEFKADTRSLSDEPDDRLEAFYRINLRERFENVSDEILFVNQFAEKFRDKAVLSFGSGFGFQEILFERQGARVTCMDIVKENIGVIQRISKIWKLENLSTAVQSNASELGVDRTYDCIYAHGSIHHMPFENQIELFKAFDRALNDGGEIIVMIYTDYFMRVSGAAGDPQKFARYTDPDSEGIANPWSEAYDIQKLQALGGQAFVLTHHQPSNNGLYAWARFERRKDNDIPVPQPFFDMHAVRDKHFQTIIDAGPESFRPIEAADTALQGAEISSSRQPGQYAAKSDVFCAHWTRPLLNVRGLRHMIPNPATEQVINSAIIESEIYSGGFSVQLTDAASGENLVSVPVHAKERAVNFATFRPLHVPRGSRIYLSIFQPFEEQADHHRGLISRIQFGWYDCPLHEALMV